MKSGKNSRRSKALKLISELRHIHAHNTIRGTSPNTNMTQWEKDCVRELRKLDTKVQELNATIFKLKKAQLESMVSPSL